MSVTSPQKPLPSANRPKLERRPRMNFETWSWYFMRISGLVLIFLALLHFSITHILYDVVDTNAAFVAARWDNPLWRIYDWTLLAFLWYQHAVVSGYGMVDDFKLGVKNLGHIFGKRKGGTHRYGEAQPAGRNQFLDTLDTGLDAGV